MKTLFLREISERSYEVIEELAANEHYAIYAGGKHVGWLTPATDITRRTDPETEKEMQRRERAYDATHREAAKDPKVRYGGVVIPRFNDTYRDKRTADPAPKSVRPLLPRPPKDPVVAPIVVPKMTREEAQAATDMLHGTKHV